MTVRTRLMVVTVLGLAAAMAVWGWVQLKALEETLDGQVGTKLQGIGETVGTYYLHFPTGEGLSALDEALKDHIVADPTLARIDLFTFSQGLMDYVAGAGRVAYEWPAGRLEQISRSPVPRFLKMETEGGAALGLLYPVHSEKDGMMQACVGVIAYSQSNAEILARSRSLLVFTSGGLLLLSVVVLALSYRWLIGRPLGVIVQAMDEYGKGRHLNRIPLNRRDEWGQLSDHFNSMAVEIERVLDKNQELNRSLEARVQEATHKVVQLQQQVNQLQQLTAMGYLTATLAHDLGTPLHSIAGLAQLMLEREGWPSDVRRKLELIVQQTLRLDRVIQNVRRATRLPEPHFETIAVEELLNDTLSLVEPLAQKCSTRFLVRVAPGTSPLLGDRHRLQTALLNLIQNAMEAMPGGGVVTVSASGTPPGSVEITVEDTGPGIPALLLPRVFQPFFSTRPEEGMKGLGLSIVQDIMKVHGGEVELESEEGSGTRVTLRFPLASVLPAERPRAGAV